MNKPIFPRSIIILLSILVLIFFGLVGGIVYLSYHHKPSVNSSLETIIDIPNDTVTKNTYTGQKLNFDRHYDLYINVTTDNTAAVLLMTENELEKIQKDPNYEPNIISIIKSDSAIIPLDAGQYALVIAAGDKDVKYSLSLKVK